MNRLLLVALVMGFSSACAGVATVDLLADNAADTAQETRGGEVDTTASDAGSEDFAVPDVPVSQDSGPDWMLDVGGEEAGPACKPGDGCFGDACTSNGDCQSGYCVEHAGQGVCTVACQEECPAGWSCKETGGGPDVTFICVSNFGSLCKPCATGEGCTSAGGVSAACVMYGTDGSFCAGFCDAGTPCPAGFACTQSQTAEGASVMACVADSLECPCTAKSIAEALSTPCEVTNDFGTCGGVRTCEAEGLSGCDAATPAAETCDGLDNDCDGDLDEPNAVGGKFVDLCDDGNDCTEGLCLGAEGCSYEAIDTGECKDGDACTAGDHCEQGLCVGLPIVCDDADPCTDDACDGLGGCKTEFNTAACDDGDPCTVADECLQGVCAGVAVDCECQADADCVPLDDGNLCTGVLVCNTAKLPHVCVVKPGSVPECAAPPAGPDAVCLKAACVPETGTCTVVIDHEGMACSDGDACTVGDACQQGKCVGGGGMGCNDGNPCTDDACDPAVGCTHSNNTVACNDGDACTTLDTCAGGECVGGPALVCDDGNVCNGSETCLPAVGCQAGKGLVCDDNDPCTGVETCDPKTGCLPGEKPNCNDGNVCTTDACQKYVGCVYAFNDMDCDDGNTCTTTDYCAMGVCVGTDVLPCNDNNVCTDDSCNPAVGCVFKANQAPCNDGNACTLVDTCVAGMCKGSGAPDCDDANPCTKDACTPAGGCAHVPAAGACSDGNPCTVNDFCDAGKCQAGKLVGCDDGNPCTDDACVDGVCQHAANAAACDDGNQCTTVDVCVSGTCKGSKAPSCDDGDVCTDDLCDPEVGCTHVLNNALCTDGDVCTFGDHCEQGKCVSTGSMACGDNNACTDDTCHPALGCTFTPNQAGCNDGNACTTGDTCAAGVCKPGAGVKCDDGNVCTDDACDPLTGCKYTPNVAVCDDGNKCTVGDVCAAGKCVAGGSLACDDGNKCTNNGCDPATGCVYTPVSPCCGNSVVEAGEECDEGAKNGTGTCGGDCKFIGPINVTFSNCGQSGPTGPSQGQCDGTYAGNVWLAGKVTVSAGTQQWTVPYDGTYRIEAYGARGGRGGGLGARMRGDFTLTKGTVLKIIVGQQGLQAPANVGSGGGGGSYVAKSDNTPLLVAGGGSGTGHDGAYSGDSNLNGRTDTSGAAGLCGNAGAGGTNGNGGGYATTTGNGTPNAAGGAGFYGNGGTSGAAKGGFSFVNGGNGGNSTGGFGGGGGSDVFIYGCGSSPHGGSGGGGYSGGGGGGDNCNCGGGGGGSYNTGNNQSNSAGVNSGHGQVTIQRL